MELRTQSDYIVGVTLGAALSAGRRENHERN
jgi:hypothetical protein